MNEHHCQKRFWKYVKHIRSDNIGVFSLKSDEKLYSRPADRAELLNKQCYSVFSSSEEVSQEDISQNYIISTEESSFLVLFDIDITLNDIKKTAERAKP